MDFTTAETPEIYWAKKITYKCSNCGSPYEVLMPAGNELIKYVEKDGYEERWLPTYGKGGYFDLLEKLIPGFKRNDEITVPVAKEFENKFSYLQEHSAKGNTFTTIFEVYCPECNSKNNKIKKEETVKNPDILWLRYHLGKI